MINHFNEPVKRNSSAVVKIVLKDESGYATVPVSVQWTLTRSDGVTIINSRQNVSVTPTAATRILMSAADLAVFADDDNLRLVKISATYNSTDGNNLPWETTVSFYVR
jgi:hypothetical protein